MKRSVLISGVSGTGKSSVCDALATLGHETHGIEDVEGMFAMYRKGTEELFTDFDNSDPEKIKDSEWRCDVNKFKELIAKQKQEIAFYCGVASNMDDIIPLFDTFIVLTVSKEELHRRLSSREGTNDMGSTEESRQAVLGWKDWWEETMRDKGAILVDAHGSPDDIAKEILKIANALVDRGSTNP